MSRTEPTLRIVTMTPGWAHDLLKRNTRNRGISTHNYQTIRRALINGEWELNGEAIKIAENGTVLDGQHRLQACVDTGISFRTVLIENLPAETQDTMDTGKSRNLGDILNIRGESYATQLAALIKRHILIERTGTLAIAFSSTISGGGNVVTNHECMAWLEANGWVRTYAMPGKKLGRSLPLSGASVGVLMRVFDCIDPDDAKWFWGRLEDGAALPDGHPILALRKSFQIVTAEVRGEKNQRYLAAITIKAWNAYRSGDSVQQLKYRTGGAKPEPFPEPK